LKSLHDIIPQTVVSVAIDVYVQGRFVRQASSLNVSNYVFIFKT